MMYLYVLFGVIVFLLLFISLLIWCLCKRRYNEHREICAMLELGNREESVEPLVSPPVSNNSNDGLQENFEIDESNLEMYKIIETGSFYKGKLSLAFLRSKLDETDTLTVIVRSAEIVNDGIELNLLRMTLNVISHIPPHPNILSYLGFVRNETKVCIVTEYPIGGNLFSYLKKFQKEGFNDQLTEERNNYNIGNLKLDSNMDCLCTVDLISFAYQISNGMDYLEKLSIKQLQLCLHNVMISNDKTIRISGLTLAGAFSGNYRCNDETGILPPCKCEYVCKFSTKADIRDFAICMHEIFSLGETSDEVMRDGKFLAQPALCHNEIYHVMQLCWNADPEKILTFWDCILFFRNHMETFNIQIQRQIDEKLQEAARGQRQLLDCVNFRRKSVKP